MKIWVKNIGFLNLHPTLRPSPIPKIDINLLHVGRGDITCFHEVVVPFSCYFKLKSTHKELQLKF